MSVRVMPSKDSFVDIGAGCVFKVEDILTYFGSIPEIFTDCFVCKERAIYVVCGNLDRDDTGVEQMSYGDDEDEEIVHALLTQSHTSIAFPTCLVHTRGSAVN
jgi:hypothetical protein